MADRATIAGSGHASVRIVIPIAKPLLDDVEGDALDSMHLERWLATHVVCRIPGASGERK